MEFIKLIHAKMNETLLGTNIIDVFSKKKKIE